jgi:hypothetical protein
MQRNNPSQRAVRCSRCGTENPINTIQCIVCNKVILNGLEYFFINLSVAALLLAANLACFAIYDRPKLNGILNELTYQIFPSICVATLFVKFIQKARNPERNIKRELVGLYTDTTGRLLIILVCLTIAWITPDLIKNGGKWPNIDPHKSALLNTSIAFGIGYLFLYFQHIGLLFFNTKTPDVMTSTNFANLQSRKNKLIKKIARISVINRLQKNDGDLDLTLFGRKYAHLYGLSPEQGAEIIDSIDPRDYLLFESACQTELLNTNSLEFLLVDINSNDE